MKKLDNNQVNQTDNNNSELEPNQEQNLVLQLILRGQSIFLTGSAGTGKSFLLKKKFFNVLFLCQ